MTEQEILRHTFDYVESRYSSDAAVLSVDDHLLENGIIDSLSLLDLVSFLEQTFSISIDDDDVDLDNFETIRSIARFVASKPDR